MILKMLQYRILQVPLTKAGVDLMALEEEWLDMVYYAKTYLNLEAMLFGGS